MSNQGQNPIQIIFFPLQCDDSRFNHLYNCLSQDEKQRADRYRFDVHRNRFIVGRATVREIIAKKMNLEPHSIRFKVNPFGKPAILCPDCLGHIHFSVSRSQDMGGIALSENFPLGFDMESRKNNNYAQELDLIVKNQFSQIEYTNYSSITIEDRIHFFYKLWTCKEAYLKALGIGLRVELNSFTIDFQKQQPFILYSELENRKKSEYLLYQIKNVEEVVACLASKEHNVPIFISHRPS